ncbi:MAG: DEAD/DEAH box helicase, partial [Pseudomonadota bacterium]
MTRAPRPEQAPRAPRAEQAPRAPRPEQAPRAPRPEQAPRAPRAEQGPRAPRAEQGPRAPREGQEGQERQERQERPERAPKAAPAAREVFRNPLPAITYPEDLPVSGRRGDIAKALQENQVIIVCGETGSGKTTQLPKICLELGRGQKALIGHTQPRRIAASSTAKRIAQELGSPLGEHVGFKVRFTDTLTRGASVKLMTDGILLAETQTDPMLRNYDTIIIDEAHERSLNIDFLLGYLKQLLPRRPDLKVIITSATIDADRFARHFGTASKPAPVIEVSGRLYQVELRYRPVERDQVQVGGIDSGKPQPKAAAAREKRDLMDAVVEGVDELCRLGSGDVLVFLPGEREIRDCAEALRK